MAAATKKTTSTLPELGGYATMSEKMRNAPNVWKGTATNGDETKLYIDGEWVSSETKDWIEVHDPVGTKIAVGVDVKF